MKKLRLHVQIINSKVEDSKFIHTIYYYIFTLFGEVVVRLKDKIPQTEDTETGQPFSPKRVQICTETLLVLLNIIYLF